MRNVLLSIVTLSVAMSQTPRDVDRAALPATGSVLQEPVVSVVPRPAKVERLAGAYTLNSHCRVVVRSPELQQVGQYLADRLGAVTGMKVPVMSVDEDELPGAILLTPFSETADTGDEGYELSVLPASIIIRAQKPAGAFYAAQTVRQLLPPQGETVGTNSTKAWRIPTVRITDSPRFAWRGLLLDVSRHFRDKEFVKRYIDLLAYHKMNVLHWHLVDDQGWRIEIKKYAKLTEIGAWRDEGGKRYGGFYTQDDIREVVAYAASRFITVVPEIEMPGHCNAAIAAYPQFSCTGGPFKVPSIWGVMQDVYCAGNEETFGFAQDILGEVLELFPSKWIHIGGDEVDKARWKACPKCQRRIKDEHLKGEHELQSYFIRRIDAFLQSKGRRLIGWDEILEGGLAAGATVQSWRGMDGAVAACKMDHDVIVSPTSHCYLDYPLYVTSLAQTYSLNPIPAQIPSEQAKHVLGVEGNIWSERTPLPADTDRQVFPRLCAVAEVGWSPAASRDFADFSARMKTHLRRLRMMGIVYGDLGTKIGEWSGGKVSKEYKPLEWDAARIVDRPGRYELSLWYERGAHALSIKWAAILEDGKEVARTTHDAWTGHDTRDNTYRIYLRTRNAGAKYSVRVFARGEGGTDSIGSVWLRCLDE